MITYVQISVSRTDGDPPPLSLLSPPLPRVSVQRTYVCGIKNASVCARTTPTCGNTCAPGAGAHGDVLNLHTEVFSACQAAPHTTPTTQHNTTRQNTTRHHNTQHHNGDRERERQRETERNRERQRETEKERQDKTRKEKTRQ